MGERLALLGGLQTEVKVGLMIMAALVLLVYASLRVTSYDPDLTDTYEIKIPFDNVTGLALGTAIRVAGIQVGEVVGIDLVEGRAMVTVAVYEKYRLHADARAAIKSIGILGDKYIEVTLGSPNQQYLTQGDAIGLVDPSSDLDSLIEDVTYILDDIRQVTTALRNGMGGEKGERQITMIVGNLETLTTDLREISSKTNGEIGPILQNLHQFTGDLSAMTGENRENLRQTVGNFRDFSENLSDFMVENQGELSRILDHLDTLMAGLAKDGPRITNDLQGILQENRSNLKETMEEIRTASSNLNQAMESLDSIAYKVDSGQGTLGKLVNDEETINSVNQALDGVNEFINPVNKMKIGMGFQTEKLVERDRYKSYVNLDLRPVRDHYYTIQLVSTTDGSQTKTQTLVKDNANNSVTSNTTTYETVDSYRLSMLVTQRYFDSELKFGLLENTAGFGVNQFFGKKDQFRLDLTAFEFNRDTEPAHLRAGGSWSFMQNFYLTAGVDDFINPSTDLLGQPKKNPFVGVGISFTEDNMKPVLGTTSGVLTGQ